MVGPKSEGVEKTHILLQGIFNRAKAELLNFQFSLTSKSTFSHWQVRRVKFGNFVSRLGNLGQHVPVRHS